MCQVERQESTQSLHRFTVFGRIWSPVKDEINAKVKSIRLPREAAFEVSPPTKMKVGLTSRVAK